MGGDDGQVGEAAERAGQVSGVARTWPVNRDFGLPSAQAADVNPPGSTDVTDTPSMEG